MKEASRRYIVDDMLPISTVESPAFIQLVKSFRSDIVVPCRRTMTDFIIRHDSTMLTNLKTELRKVVVKTKDIFQPFATSFDAWSARNRSYLGMTVNWIDDTLERQTRVLACKRFPAPHTYERVTNIVLEIHAKYGIEGSVAHIITDNGSNMVKCGGVGIEEALLAKYQEDDVALEGMGVCAILDHMKEESDNMPRHNRCASQTLNLLASGDVEKWLASLPLSNRFKITYRYSTLHMKRDSFDFPMLTRVKREN